MEKPPQKRTSSKFRETLLLSLSKQPQHAQRIKTSQNLYALGILTGFTALGNARGGVGGACSRGTVFASRRLCVFSRSGMVPVLVDSVPPPEGSRPEP